MGLEENPSKLGTLSILSVSILGAHYMRQNSRNINLRANTAVHVAEQEGS
jgi:hypothetical protein